MAASLFVCLAFLNVSTSSSTVFSYFVSLSTVLGLINWVNILVSYHYFTQALKVQGIPRSSLPWRGVLLPHAVYVVLALTILVIILNGFSAFINGFKIGKFMTSYVGIALYLFNISAFKLWSKTETVRASEVDLVTGRGQHSGEMEEEVAKNNLMNSIISALVGK